MSLYNRVEKLEAGMPERGGGPCPLCERRAEAEVAREAHRKFGEEFVEELFQVVEMECLRCGQPFNVNVVGVTRKAAA